MREKLAAARRRAERVASRAAPSGVILLYHRVAELPCDPQLLAVTPRRFREHMEVIGSACTPLALRELVEGLRRPGRLPRRAVAITFDDGYSDNLHGAKPALDAAGVPATVFVASGYVGAGREYWWDEVERLLLAPQGVAEELELNASRTKRRWPMHTPAERQRAYDELLTWMRRAGTAITDRLLVQLRAWAGEPNGGNHRGSHLAMTRDELVELADEGHVEIGAHTRTHPSLTAESPARQRVEIVGSKADLEAWLERPVDSFAYPFGGHIAFDRATTRLVRDAGFACAMANYPVGATFLSSRYAIPRHLVRDWSGEEIERRLHAMFSD